MRPPTGSIDAVEFLALDDDAGAAPGAVGDVLVVRGWVHQPEASPAFTIVLDDDVEHPVTAGISRPDVAAAIGDPKAVDSGFAASVPTIDLADGEHTIALVASGDGARTEVARARFHLSAAVPLAHGEKGRGWIDSWTDEGGRCEPILATAAVRVPRHEVIRIEGWVADTVTESPAVAAFALIGDHVVQAAYGFERPDVAHALGEHHAYSGFAASFPGTYAGLDGTTVRLVLLASDGTTLRAGEPTVTLVGYD